MPRNFGPASLTRSATTTPKWAENTVRGRNPYSVQFNSTATDYYYFDLTSSSAGIIGTTGINTGIFSVSMWFNVPLTADAGIFELTSPATTWTATVSTTGTLQVGNGSTGIGLSGAITANTWNHMVYVVHFNAGVGTMTIFLNGVNVGSQGSMTMDLTTPQQMRFGRSSGLNFLSGYLDDVAVFREPLTLSEAQTLYAEGTPQDLSDPTKNPDINKMTTFVNQADPGTTTYLQQESYTGSIKVAGADLIWSGTNTNSPSRSTNRPTPRTNDYTDLAGQFKIWAAGSAAIDGDYALGTGVDLSVSAPALLPFPRPGWGFTSASGSYVGFFTNLPNASPQITVSGTLAQIETPAGLPIGINTDTRSVRRLRPNFVKKV
jgi:hypothetical protein